MIAAAGTSGDQGAASSSITLAPRKDRPPKQKIKIKINIEGRRQIALIIGINVYGEYPRLQNAVPDAKAVGQVLRDEYGFAHIVELYDKEATRKNILDNVRTLVESMSGGEDVFIYFSGHGYFDETLGRGYWIPSDAKDESTFLANSEIHDYIKAMNQKGVGHVFLVADSCFAGTFVGVMRALGVKPPEDRQTQQAATYFERLHASPSRMALTSGSNEEVPDGGAKGHSLFAYYLLKALQNPDHATFTASELSEKVKRNVGFNSQGIQAPRSGVIMNAGHEGGDFIFVRQK